jgi:UDP-glucose 4-epimerase
MDLALAIRELFKADNEIQIIGTRHGEKLYETLLTREEMARAIDLGGHYRILCDERDLNYGKYFTEGEEQVSQAEDYHSHNTQRLNKDEVKEVLLNLDFIKNEIKIQ